MATMTTTTTAATKGDGRRRGVNLGDTTYDDDLWTPSGTGTAAIYNDDTSEMVT